MLDYDFEESVGFWLLTTSHLYQRTLNEQLAPEGVTFRQCQVLGFLVLYGPLSQTELAERMGIEPPTLVGILDRMQRDGWIRREACPQDRRKNLICPLEAAEPIWSKIVATGRRVRAQATRDLTHEQLETLKQLLSVVRSNLGEKRSADELCAADREREKRG